MFKDFVYAVEVLEKNGTPVSVATMESRLREVVQDVQAREAKGEKAVPVGILTADDRDLWAKVRGWSIYFRLFPLSGY